MLSTYFNYKRLVPLARLLKQALSSHEYNFTSGSIRKAIFLLAIPMILEMCMESVFAVVDIFFVGKLGSIATSTVGLTESILTIIYSIAFGLSMGATAVVSRRVGEKDKAAAAKAGGQSIFIAIAISVIISIAGLLYPKQLLQLMGATPEIVKEGYQFTRLMITGNLVIMLLFLLNGIFRGAGNAAIAMRSLWIANIFNIILCPLLIHFFGLNGAAYATITGRSIGVGYQLFYLLGGKGILDLRPSYLRPVKAIIGNIMKIASTGTLQFIVGSASWIVMARLMTDFGSDAIAGYTIAIRWLIFFILPAFGLSNAAATLVGQNLGAGLPERAEKSVWQTAKYNAIFMFCVTLLFITAPDLLARIMSDNAAVQSVTVQALRIISLGFVFYGIGMVMMNAFNGAGDTRTPTLVYFVWFWLIQIPLAYLLAIYWDFGPKGIFIAIVTAEACITITTMLLFKKGRWKKIQI